MPPPDPPPVAALSDEEQAFEVEKASEWIAGNSGAGVMFKVDAAHTTLRWKAALDAARTATRQAEERLAAITSCPYCICEPECKVIK